MGINSDRLFSGHGMSLHQNGRKLTYVDQVEAKIEWELAEIQLPGQLMKQHKRVSGKGSGTISGFLYTTGMIQLTSRPARDQKQSHVDFVGSIENKEDPGRPEKIRIRLKNIQFTEGTLMNFKVGEVVRFEVPFVFDGYELMDGAASR